VGRLLERAAAVHAPQTVVGLYGSWRWTIPRMERNSIVSRIWGNW
jgi:hypothetical protein